MRTRIIAEIASCHNGDLDLAKALIVSAAKNGADLVKFQDWRAKNVSENDPDKYRYEQYEFKEKWYKELIPFCKDCDVEFLTTCFNSDRAEYLSSLGLKKIKIASISLTNKELISKCGSLFDELVISTGMHTKTEIKEAIMQLAINTKKFTIMHCVANYPTLAKDANLDRIDELKKMVEVIDHASVGYSDHSLELSIAKIAIATGISYIEKHFTLSRDLPQIPHQMYKDGPKITTHEISIEPHELKELAKWRDMVEIVKGKGGFERNEIEMAIRNRYKDRYGK